MQMQSNATEIYGKDEILNRRFSSQNVSSGNKLYYYSSHSSLGQDELSQNPPQTSPNNHRN